MAKKRKEVEMDSVLNKNVSNSNTEDTLLEKHEFTKDFLDRLSSERKKISLKRAKELEISTANEIIAEFGSINTPPKGVSALDQGLAAFAIMAQQGATARGCDGNLSATIFGNDFKLAQLRKILRSKGLGKSERKLARALAQELFQISLCLDIPGNLSGKISQKDPSVKFTRDELIWMSDYQAYNQNCPDKIRTLLLDSFNRQSDDPKVPGPKKSGK